MDAMDVVKSILPFIGTALGGPIGGAAATFIGSKLGLSDTTIEAVKNTLSGMTPEQLQVLKDHDHEFSLQMQAAGFANVQALAEIEFKTKELDTKNMEAVNTTMQSESASAHWPSYSWRPFIGFQFGFYLMSMWALPLVGVKPVELSAFLVTAIGGILGVASYFRGKAQADPAVQISNKG